MKLKDMPIEELELLSYTDLTYLLIKENKKPLNTPTVFKEICDLLGYTDSDFSNKIGDYYTSLAIDKRFVLLDSNEWDIRDNHSVEIVIDDDDSDDTEEEVEEFDEEEVEESEEESEDIDDLVDDIDDDDMEDLSIVADDELEEE